MEPNLPTKSFLEPFFAAFFLHFRASVKRKSLAFSGVSLVFCSKKARVGVSGQGSFDMRSELTTSSIFSMVGSFGLG